MALDMTPLLTEILNNAKAVGREMTRAQAIAHLARHATQLIRDKHVPPGTRERDIIAALNDLHA